MTDNDRANGEIVDYGLADGPPTEHQQLIHNQIYISKQLDFLRELVSVAAKETEHGILAKLLPMEAHGQSLEERIAGIEAYMMRLKDEVNVISTGVARTLMMLSKTGPATA